MSLGPTNVCTILESAIRLQDDNKVIISNLRHRVNALLNRLDNMGGYDLEKKPEGDSNYGLLNNLNNSLTAENIELDGLQNDLCRLEQLL